MNSSLVKAVDVNEWEDLEVGRVEKVYLADHASIDAERMKAAVNASEAFMAKEAAKRSRSAGADVEVLAAVAVVVGCLAAAVVVDLARAAERRATVEAQAAGWEVAVLALGVGVIVGGCVGIIVGILRGILRLAVYIYLI